MESITYGNRYSPFELASALQSTSSRTEGGRDGKQDTVHVVVRRPPSEGDPPERGKRAGLRAIAGTGARPVRGHGLPEFNLLRLGRAAARTRARCRGQSVTGFPGADGGLRPPARAHERRARAPDGG